MNKTVSAQARRLLDRLRRDFELHHRRKGAVDRRSGHYRGWFRALLDRAPERLTVYQLASAAEGLGLDPVELLAEAIEPGPAELLRTAREATHGKRDRPPAAIQKLHTAARRLIRHRTDSTPRPGVPAPSRQDARSCLLHGPLDLRRRDLKQSPRWRSLAAVRRAARAIDDLRYRAPWDAVELAEILTLEVAGKLKGPDGVEAFTRAAAVLGSSHRIAASLEGASHCLQAALMVAQWAPGRVRADLLQRVSFALSGHGEISAALAVSDKAMAMFAAQRDSAGMGKVYVDQATFLNYSGQADQARQASQNALALLPDSEPRNRGAAYQGLAHLDEQAGRLDDAAEWLELAAAFIPIKATYPRAMAEWSAASIAWRREQLADAERDLRTAVKGLGQVNPFDTSLASLDLVELLLARGRPAEAVESARCMAALLEPFRANRIAAAALVKLTHQARRGTVDLAAVKAARRTLSGGRCRGIRPPGWR